MKSRLRFARCGRGGAFRPSRRRTDIYYGLWYPIVVAVMSLIIGSLFLSETRHRDIRTYEHMLP